MERFRYPIVALGLAVATVFALAPGVVVGSAPGLELVTAALLVASGSMLVSAIAAARGQPRGAWVIVAVGIVGLVGGGGFAVLMAGAYAP